VSIIPAKKDVKQSLVLCGCFVGSATFGLGGPTRRRSPASRTYDACVVKFTGREVTVGRDHPGMGGGGGPRGGRRRTRCGLLPRAPTLPRRDRGARPAQGLPR
jgi:hypothetical protein